MIGAGLIQSSGHLDIFDRAAGRGNLLTCSLQSFEMKLDGRPYLPLRLFNGSACSDASRQVRDIRGIVR
jgi:hypothetical protein